MSPLFITMLFGFLAVSAAAAVYGAMYGDYRALQEQVAGLAIKLRSSRSSGGSMSVHDEGLATKLVRLTATRLPARKGKQPGSVAKMLAQAGYRGSASVQSFYAIQILLALGLAFGGFTSVALFGLDPSMALLVGAGGACLGAMAPKYYLLRAARKRRQAITHQLTDVLDLLVVCVEAGLGIHEAISMVGREIDRHGQEIGDELVLLSRDMSAGATLGEALRRFAERTDVEDVKPLAAAMIQSEQLGAQIAPSLRANSDALRGKRRLKAEESAQKATIKILFPLVLFVLPAMLLVIVGPSIVHVIRTLNG